MRALILFSFALLLGGALSGQQAAATSDKPVHVRKLILTASDLPSEELKSISASIEGGTFTLDALHDRIEQKLRDQGYYFVHAENPQLADTRQEGAERSADVSVQVQVGIQYRMGQINFRNAKAFPGERLRSVFPIQEGSIFNASAIAAGLEGLKKLYESEGYADVGAVPANVVDEARHVIDVSVEVEEGDPYLFGPLTLEGDEPGEGMGKALLTAWKEIEGKRYNPDLLRKWLTAHAPKAPPGAPPIHPHAEGIADPDAHLMDVRLSFE
jgi:outer membrane protein assembly factor BamA